MKLEGNNKKFSKWGHPLCGNGEEQGCGGEVIIGVVIKGVIYCCKCAEILKGVRDKKGMKRRIGG